MPRGSSPTRHAVAAVAEDSAFALLGGKRWQFGRIDARPDRLAGRVVELHEPAVIVVPLSLAIQLFMQGDPVVSLARLQMQVDLLQVLAQYLVEVEQQCIAHALAHRDQNECPGQ